MAFVDHRVRQSLIKPQRAVEDSWSQRNDHLDSVRQITPASAIAPPSNDRTVGFSPSNTRASGITVNGVSATMDITTPVGVVSNPHCIALTPSVWPARLFNNTQGQIRRHFS